nr:hypothetical protein BaRGS_018103 [Batillaria attramentaria]
MKTTKGGQPPAIFQGAAVGSGIETSRFHRTDSITVRAGTREVHNKLEKNRRAHLKECFDVLKKQIPQLEEKKTSNLGILRGSLKLIQTLKRKERENELELQRLAQEKSRLRHRFERLHNELDQLNVKVDHFMQAPDQDQESNSTSTATVTQLLQQTLEKRQAQSKQQQSGVSQAGAQLVSPLTVMTPNLGMLGTPLLKQFPLLQQHPLLTNAQVLHTAQQQQPQQSVVNPLVVMSMPSVVTTTTTATPAVATGTKVTS